MMPLNGESRDINRRFFLQCAPHVIWERTSLSRVKRYSHGSVAAYRTVATAIRILPDVSSFFFVFPFSYYYCSHVAWRQDKVDATFSVKTKSDCKNASCAIYTVHASSIVHFYPVSMYISIVPACGIVYHHCVMHVNSRSRSQYIGKNKSL